MVKVEISNFQSLGEISLDVEGFTVVTGRNNTGKTAVLRAIQGVFQNTPGNTFVREGQTKCEVTVDFGVDGSLTWSKGTTSRERPTYRITGLNDPINPGSGVPEEVKSFRVVPLKAGNKEVWPTIASQFGGQVFLLDQSPSFIAECIADVERVGKLNQCLRNVQSDLRSVKSELKVRESDLKTVQQQLTSFDGLDFLITQSKVLSKQEDQLIETRGELRELELLHVQYQNNLAFTQNLAPLDDLAMPSHSFLLKVEGALEFCEKAFQQQNQALQTVNALEGLGALESRLSVLEVRDNYSGQIHELEGLSSRFQAALKQYKTLTLMEVSAQDDLNQHTQNIHQWASGLEECPLCGKIQ